MGGQKQPSKTIDDLRRDLEIVLVNLRWIEEATGETLEGEDAFIVKQIEDENKAALANSQESTT
ncbi:hypothetical protein KL86PLE_100301 [uncultured Pleomorphomonas sp.]|uniref:Uncharacterized protein n=1 Tax=uncultured Pleomorphomonas sp. TaxID=442121 RepID=A0A212L288_9HYPH|nr:hypothetical protein [uncultured Pleomorphomonas sp.]SCM71662.1 hypothetical protein KL86PLE_100301 [uncultured Pleomorphomonas sp.]